MLSYLIVHINTGTKSRTRERREMWRIKRMMRMELAKQGTKMWMIIERIVCLPMAFCLFYDRLIDWPSSLSVSPSTRTSDEKLMISSHLHQV